MYIAADTIISKENNTNALTVEAHNISDNFGINANIEQLDENTGWHEMVGGLSPVQSDPQKRPPVYPTLEQRSGRPGREPGASKIHYRVQWQSLPGVYESQRQGCQFAESHGGAG